jgi:hypothetical protein
MVVVGLLLSCCLGRPGSVATSATSPEPTIDLAEHSQKLPSETEAPTSMVASEGQSASRRSTNSERLWYEAVEAAGEAAQLAQTAISADDWGEVVQAWGRSIERLQAIPANDPRRLFSQRKAREYMQNLQVAQERAEQTSALRMFPSLGSPILDEQVNLYRSYVATMGAPDILILGSSRALQGLDPQALQQSLAWQGYPNLRVYNFSVNGATAQVVSFITRQLFAPDLYPKLVIWAGNSRAFNSGNFDRTFAQILDSPGYASIRNGENLTTSPQGEKSASPLTLAQEALPISAIDSLGFLVVENQFNPTVYYRSFPRVIGRYDEDYRSFRLDGVQTVSFEAVTQFFKAQNIPLVFVNLPLSSDYLDAGRAGYERQFQTFLQGWANNGAITLVNLVEQWRNQSQYFADPSHINRFGAREVARLLAADTRVPWMRLTASEETPG